MADVVSSQTSAHWVAYRLMQDIFLDAKKGEHGKVWRSKEEILNLYAECYEAATGGRAFRTYHLDTNEE